MGIDGLRTEKSQPSEYEPRPYETFISGPWYDDSDPCGRGMTEDESIINAVAELIDWGIYINEVLADLPERIRTAAESIAMEKKSCED